MYGRTDYSANITIAFEARNTLGQVWNTVTGAYERWNKTNWFQYLIPADSPDGSGEYTATAPDAGIVRAAMYIVGATYATSSIQWTWDKEPAKTSDVTALGASINGNITGLQQTVSLLPDSQDVQFAAAAALTAYAPLTGTQATSNTNAILGAVDDIDTGSIPPEQLGQIVAAAERVLAVPGEPDTPLDLIPAYTPPTGIMRVLLRPTRMKQLVDRKFEVYYKDQVPLVDNSIEMVKEGSEFEKDEAKFGPTYKGLEMPIGDSVFYVPNSLAALDSQEKRARFKVVDIHGTGVVFLDELITRYNSPTT